MIVTHHLRATVATRTRSKDASVLSQPRPRELFVRMRSVRTGIVASARENRRRAMLGKHSMDHAAKPPHD